MTHTYSNSELQCYKNCPLQWRFKYELGLRSREADGSENHHLEFGRAFDAGLEQLYSGNGIRTAQEALIAAYPVQLDVRDQAKTAANGIATLRDYATRWQDEDRKWRILEIQSWSKDAETDELDTWNVKPDLVIENLEHGGIYIVDHKTTGKYLDYRYWEQFQPNSQITYYLDYATAKYGKVEGFIINAIAFRYRQRAYKGEPAGFWNAFERQIFNRNASQLEFERLSRAAWIADLERSKESGFYRTNTESCRFCAYKSLCAPGWTWEYDQELIELMFFRACRRRVRGCVLDLEHEGECRVAAVRPVEMMQIEVDV